MARPKKFEARVVPEPGGFAAQVVRRRTSRSTQIVRTAGGFATEAEAHQWASAQLDAFLARQAETRAKQAARRRHRRERLEAERTMSLRELAEFNPRSSRLRDQIEVLWQEVAFRAWKQDGNEDRACAIANQSVGGAWSERLANARSGKLDEIAEWTTTQALANAVRLAGLAVDRT